MKLFTNKQITNLIWLPVLLLTLSACDSKNTTTSDTQKASEVITVVEPYIRAMPPGQPVTAMFLQLNNASADLHSLVKAKSDVSKSVELHEHKMQDGMMKMGQVAQIDLAPNQTTALKPGGYHIMLIGLKNDLAEGQNVDVNLVFQDGSNIKIQAPVKKIQTN